MKSAARLKAIVADPVADFAGDVAAMLQGGFEVSQVRNQWMALPALLLPCDLLILANDLPPVPSAGGRGAGRAAQRVLDRALERGARVVCLGKLAVRHTTQLAGQVVFLERYPSPETLQRAMTELLAT